MKPFESCEREWVNFGILFRDESSKQAHYIRLLVNIACIIGLSLAVWWTSLFIYVGSGTEDVMTIVFGFLQGNVALANLMAYISLALNKRVLAHMLKSFKQLIESQRDPSNKDIYDSVQIHTKKIIYILYFNYTMYSGVIIFSFSVQLAWDYFIRGTIDVAKWYNLLVFE